QRRTDGAEILVGPAPELHRVGAGCLGQPDALGRIAALGGEQHLDAGGQLHQASRVPPLCISSRIPRAAAAGSAASMIGRATTRWVAPAAMAWAGPITRFWSPAAVPAGRIPRVTIAILGPMMVRTISASCGEATMPPMPASRACCARSA